MSHLPANPFAAILKAAALSPAETGEVAKFTRRLQGPGTATLLLLDVSSSMEGQAGSKRKIEILRDALNDVMPSLLATKASVIRIAFSSTAAVLSGTEDIPEPNGGTALHLALEEAAKHAPALTLVISDGQPDSEDRALEAADAVPGCIDVIYVGPDDDAAALAFMRKLARIGGGRVHIHDLRKAGRSQLAGAVRQVLALPAKGVD